MPSAPRATVARVEALARGVGNRLALGLNAGGAKRTSLFAHQCSDDEADRRDGQERRENDFKAALPAPLPWRLARRALLPFAPFPFPVRCHWPMKRAAASLGQRTKSRATDSHTCPGAAGPGAAGPGTAGPRSVTPCPGRSHNPRMMQPSSNTR